MRKVWATSTAVVLASLLLVACSGGNKMPDVGDEEVTTPSGLTYVDIQVGSGDPPQPGQTVVVHYTGYLEEDGSKFASSLDAGQPLEFPVGVGAVIPGWDEGVSTMKVGGERRLIIPPALAYGERGGETIPPNATIILDVELVEIR